jgi:diguanylate cyclase (GGDEF)-like protein
MNYVSCTLTPQIATYDELIKKLKTSEVVNYYLLDVDNFSNINSAYGYEVGDKVLHQISRYLDIVKPEHTLLYKFSSDKFVLIDDRKLKSEEIIKIVEAILSFFSQTELLIDNELELKISLSIGISTEEGLKNISNAELAIKELRKSKRNHYHIYDEKSPFILSREKNIYWILKIKDAIDNEDIVAYFQPIINNQTKKIEKYECLARLKDDDEIISPYLFMDATRLTGNLSYVTKSLIIQSFKKFSNSDLEFSINITGEDFLLGYLELFLMKNIEKYNIDPSHVVLEMLEDITSLNTLSTAQQLASLRKLGFKIAIDDFGAENSNLSRLLEIQPDYLKIDGAFIKNIIEDKKSQIIVDGIVLICKKSNIKIIAEYIHNKEIQEYVKALGIEYSQGFYFGEPKPDLIELSVSV